MNYLVTDREVGWPMLSGGRWEVQCLVTVILGKGCSPSCYAQDICVATWSPWGMGHHQRGFSTRTGHHVSLHTVVITSRREQQVHPQHCPILGRGRRTQDLATTHPGQQAPQCCVLPPCGHRTGQGQLPGWVSCPANLSLCKVFASVHWLGTVVGTRLRVTLGG